MADKCTGIKSNPDIAGIGVSLRHPCFSRLYIAHWMITSLDPLQFLHHDARLYLYTRGGLHRRTSEWDIQELHHQRSRSPLYRRNPDHAGGLGPVSRISRVVYHVFLQYRLSVRYVLMSIQSSFSRIDRKSG